MVGDQIKQNANVNESVVAEIFVEGVKITNVLIDSGASCNLIDKETWENLKQQGIDTELNLGATLHHLYLNQSSF